MTNYINLAAVSALSENAASVSQSFPWADIVERACKKGLPTPESKLPVLALDDTDLDGKPLRVLVTKNGKTIGELVVTARLKSAAATAYVEQVKEAVKREEARADEDEKPTVAERVAKINLTETQKLRYVKLAAEVRYRRGGNSGVIVDATPLLGADTSNNLWQIFNRVENSILNGGVKIGLRTLSPIRSESIRQSMQARLWNLTLKFMEELESVAQNA